MCRVGYTVEPMRDPGFILRAGAGREHPKAVVELLGIGIDHHAADLLGPAHRQVGLSRGGRAGNQDVANGDGGYLDRVTIRSNADKTTARARQGGRTMTEDTRCGDVVGTLNQIVDPKTGLGLVEAGLVKGLVVGEDRAGFVIEVAPTDAATYAPIRDAAEAALAALPGMTRVHVVLTTEQPAARPRRGAGLSQAALDQGRPSAPVATDRPEFVQRVIAVASGKGGVGKSTVAVNLAAALARRGLRVGLLDADVYGPSVPLMLKVNGSPQHDGERLVPLESSGVKVMSTGLLVGADRAMVWRGPMAGQALTQMLTQTRWGTSDAPMNVLIVDLPPGTGDVQLTLVQKTPIDGAIVVTTPQEAALADARRAVAMFAKTGTPVLGLIENMSGEVFGKGGGEREAARLSIPFLGSIPLDAVVRKGGDEGRPVVLQDPESEVAAVLAALAAVIAS